MPKKIRVHVPDRRRRPVGCRLSLRRVRRVVYFSHDHQPMGVPVSTDLKRRLVSWHLHDGLTVRETAERGGVSIGLVSGVVKLFLEKKGELAFVVI